MIEAMACGTPVIAWGNGSVPEVVRDGLTGFVVADIDDAIRCVAQLKSIRRRDCRSVFEAHFSARRMASDYLRIYEEQIQSMADVGIRGHAIEAKL
jgi:glycosyltransferase involved in cell wall biosynthesis